LLLLIPWNRIYGRRSLMPGWLLLRWRSLGSDMTINSTLVTYESFVH